MSIEQPDEGQLRKVLGIVNSFIAGGKREALKEKRRKLRQQKNRAKPAGNAKIS